MVPVISRTRYRRGDASADELWGVVDEVLRELSQPDSEAARTARSAGLRPDELSDVRVEISEGEQGAEPILTTIIVGIAVKAGSAIAETLWKEVIWPRLRRRLGARALGAPTQGSDADKAPDDKGPADKAPADKDQAPADKVSADREG